MGSHIIMNEGSIRGRADKTMRIIINCMRKKIDKTFIRYNFGSFNFERLSHLYHCGLRE